ncbi:MAG: hypothetical protein CBC09_01055 [Cellvibrionales bacterium TMED49]|mgnify:CR=1 FL=1|nr:hypothetical protein [Porticoccaceae bacterium]OUU40026.1 MAG: hypothetical protein CBC09_01055 [Cellvibrionales bacterium TMED49]
MVLALELDRLDPFDPTSDLCFKKIFSAKSCHVSKLWRNSDVLFYVVTQKHLLGEHLNGC